MGSEVLPITAVCVLGDLRISRRPDAHPLVTDKFEAVDLTGQQPELLVALALRAGQAVEMASLKKLLWGDPDYDDNALEKVVSRLRGIVGKDVISRPRGARYYRLELPRSAVDALWFSDRVMDLGPDAVVEPEEICELLAVWRGDPKVTFPNAFGMFGKAVIDLGHQLIDHLEPRPSLTAPNQVALVQFATAFPVPERVRALLKRARRTEVARIRKRLLIVDDQHAEILRDEYLGDFECTLVHSMKEWWALEAAGPLEVDGALVDLHLTEEGTDSQGLIVLDRLREFHGVPSVLMTDFPPPGNMEDFIHAVGALALIIKDNLGGHKDVREAALRLTGDDDETERNRVRMALNAARNKAQLLHAEADIANQRQAHNRPLTVPVPAGQLEELARLVEAGHKLAEAVEGEDIAAAKAAVDAYTTRVREAGSESTPARVRSDAPSNRNFIRRAAPATSETEQNAQLLLSTGWFHARLEEAVGDAGPRYSPQVHVTIPIAQYLEAFGREGHYYDTFQRRVDMIRHHYASADLGVLHPLDSLSVQELDRLVRALLDSEIAPPPNKMLDTTAIKATLRRAQLELSNLDSHVRKAAAGLRRAEASAYSSDGAVSRDGLNRLRTSVDAQRRSLMTLGTVRRLFSSLEYSLDAREQRAASADVFFLAGEAGAGKTHMLCDVAERRLSEGKPTILLLGQQFGDSDPWAQIMRRLDLPFRGADEFLSALSDVAEATQTRALLMIDALNEGAGPVLWPKYLPGLIRKVARYPWIGLVLSLRSAYETVMFPPESRGPTKIQRFRVEHPGFSGVEYDAMRNYFDHYHINMPAVPLLQPEFRNPLFLGIFCKTLSNFGMDHVPEEYRRSLSQVFDMFLDSVDVAVRRSRGLPAPPPSDFVARCTHSIAAAMDKRGRRTLTRAEAMQIILELWPNFAYGAALYRRLVEEGVLSEDISSDLRGRPYQSVHFSYDRLADHVIARLYVRDVVGQPLPPEHVREKVREKFHDVTTKEARKRAKALKRRRRQERRRARNLLRLVGRGPADIEYLLGSHVAQVDAGLLDALSITLPEVYRVELFEMIDAPSEEPLVRGGLVRSLVWRDVSSISPRLTNLLVEWMRRPYHPIQGLLIDTLLALAPRPGHPLSADWLSRHLLDLPMGQRDAVWATSIHGRLSGYGAARRVVDWATRLESRTVTNRKVAEQIMQILAWMTASADDELRDRATKGLVLLGEKFPRAFMNSAAKLAAVDDISITERLLAAAYGIALRTRFSVGLQRLVTTVLALTTERSSEGAHLLCAEYALGVLDVARSAGSVVTADDVATVESAWMDGKARLLELTSTAARKQTKGRDESILARAASAKDFDGLLQSIIEYGTSLAQGAETDRYETRVETPERLFEQLRGSTHLLAAQIGWSADEYVRFVASDEGPDAREKAEALAYKYLRASFYWVATATVLKAGGKQMAELRDIDPSMCVRKTEEGEPGPGVWWWKVDYEFWDMGEVDEVWANRADDIPEVGSYIELEGEWLVLAGRFVFRRVLDLVTVGPTPRRRQLIIEMTPMIVRRTALRGLADRMVDGSGLDPEGVLPRFANTLFLGEYPRTRAFEALNATSQRGFGSKPPVWSDDVVPGAVWYGWEAGRDRSLARSVGLWLPSEFLVRHLHLSWSSEGVYGDRTGKIIALDPSSQESGPSALVVRRSPTLAALKAQDRVLVWSVRCVKEVVGGSDEELRRLISADLFVLQDGGIQLLDRSVTS